ncbi:hypothetical protein ACFZCK_01075 [Kitasatospora purpeofusca]|uniref:hypothetical protein n=1 Tax=Kitasatospora purpeofusca TaxID=67352 RepID=UPI0036E84F3C
MGPSQPLRPFPEHVRLTRRWRGFTRPGGRPDRPPGPRPRCRRGPNEGARRQVTPEALDRAGLSCAQVDAVEGHGARTRTSDPAEATVRRRRREEELASSGGRAVPVTGGATR